MLTATSSNCNPSFFPRLANILFVSPNSDDVKLIDFGLSKVPFLPSLHRR